MEEVLRENPCIFWLLKSCGTVYAMIVQDASGETLAPIMASKIVPDSIVYSDSWHGYNILHVPERMRV